MAAIEVILRRITRQGGRIYIRFADNNEYEFRSIAEMREEWLARPSAAKEAIHKMCVQYMLERSADGSNDASVRNMRFRFDLSAANPVTVVPEI